MRKLTTILSISLLSLGFSACAKQQGSSTSSDTDGGPTPPSSCYQPPNSNWWTCPEPDDYFYACCMQDYPLDNYYCWEEDVVGPSSAICNGDPFDPGSGGAVDTTAGDSTAGTAGDSTGGGTCNDCPEPLDDTSVCPGHAEWSRGIGVVGLWANNSTNPPVLAANFTNNGVCSQNFSVCQSYMDASGIPDLHGTMLDKQLDACRDMTLSQAENILNGSGPGGNHTLEHFWCVTNGSASTLPYMGQDYGLPASLGDNLAGCFGDWKYENYCTAADCPLDDGGTGTSTGTGGAGMGFDCSEVHKDNLSVLVDKKNNKVTVDVAPALTSAFSADAYGTMFYCSGGLMDPDTKIIWDVPRDSFLAALWLQEGDTIVKVIDSETDDNTDQQDQIAMDIMYDGQSVIYIVRKVKGKLTSYEYTINWL